MLNRITESSSTWIDNICTNYLIYHNSSDILYFDVCDHLPIFAILPDTSRKLESGREIYHIRIFSVKNRNMFCNLIG